MNLLILDDDKYVIEGVINGVDWDSLSMDNVYTALGTYQAKEIFLQYHIHILLCDIEMPNENGLSFVEWLRNEGFQTHVIFFTSHADFHYAQKAILLNSFEYVLKPIAYDELSMVIHRAALSVKKDMDSQKYQEMGHYWIEYKNSRYESFWSKLLSMQKPLSTEEIFQRVEKEMLPYTQDNFFMIIVADYGNPEDWEDLRQLELYSNQIRNQLEHIIARTGSIIETIWNETICRWFLVAKTNGCKQDKELLREEGKFFLYNNYMNLKKRGSVYFSETTTLENAFGQMEVIKQMRFHNMGFREDVFFVDEFKQRQVSYQKPDMDRLGLLMSVRDKAKAIAYIDEYLNYHAHYYELNEENLKCFMFDIMQLVFSMLRENQIEAHHLFSGIKMEELYKKALESIKGMKVYMHYLVSTALDYEKYIEEADNIVSKIVKYIDENIDKNITRADLADLVYLNPDYMSRLFKNTTNSSLLNYITKRRMEKAKQLLLTTREPICVIATKTGFPSSSYFSKKFKELYGVLPAEFKKTGEV